MNRARFPRRSLVIFLLLSAALLLGGALFAYGWLLADLPPVTALESRAVRPTTRILDRNGRLLYEVIDPDAGKQISLSLAAIPPTCRQATVATEDSRFYLHPGFDPLAILRAVVQNARSGEIVSGASTITQQLARMLLLDPEERLQPSYQRKLREAYLAWRLDSRYTKDELLALYLNQVYYGNFAFGIEAAAQIFFAKPAAQLSRAECALLAGLIQYPGGYNPLSDPDAAKGRQQTVLRLMAEAGYLDGGEVAQIDAEPLRYRSNLFEINAPHFVVYVQDQLVQMLGEAPLRAGGLTVTTTLDLDLQGQTQRAVRRRLDLLNCRTPGLCDAQTNRTRRVSNGAAVVLDAQSGEILAMVGSPDYFDAAIQGNVNGALSLRQPGSAIKPFTYAAALDPAWNAELGALPLTPATIIADLPATFYGTNAAGETEPYTPLNYDRTFHGPVSVRTALGSSYNIPAVKVLERIGVGTLRRLANLAGITSFTGDYGLALTLGGGEVRLLELTAAYGVLDDGVPVRAWAIQTVEDARLEIAGEAAIVDCRLSIDDCRGSKNVADEAASAAGQSSSFKLQPSGADEPVIDPTTAFLITDILADPLARRPAFGEGSVLDLPFAAAVKTGTTTDWRDNWTVGYSTERIVGVWVGNADNTPMVGVSGVDGAGPIWHDIMLAAHAKSPQPFPRPAAIIDVEICGPSGLLPSPACQRTRRERFIQGTEPTEVDHQFRRVAVDLATGRPATAATPPERTQERTYWLLPPEYREWMISQDIPILEQTPPDLARVADVAAQQAAEAQLILAEPTDLTRIQLHPGMPAASQRLTLRGYVATADPWAKLRLVVDGATVAAGEDVARLQTWWVPTVGEHVIWLEGEPSTAAEPVRSPPVRLFINAPEQFRETLRAQR